MIEPLWQDDEKMRFLQISVIVLFLLMQGCGRNENPVAPQSDYPDTQTTLTDSQRTVQTNRYIWGIWDVRILEDRETVEIIPDRSSTMHFNTVRLMEEVPCTTCIAIFIKQFFPPDILSVDFRLEHPFPGPMNLTAFDLRGIIINGADYTFPASNRSVGMGKSKLVLLDPDGYTSLFNPTEFSEDSGMPPVLRYYPGKLELDGDLSSTLNPFIAYSQDLPRRVFYTASAETRNIQVRLPDGPVEFGYAVDASWMPVENVVDPLVDFPPEANCVEAYRIDLPDYMEVNSGEMSEITVEIFDHQGIETISSVTVEAPEIFSGVIPFDFVESTGIESCTYSGEITNELGADLGNYPLLIRVTDKFLDDIHGQVDAWQIGEVTVVDPQGWARTWGGSGFDVGYGVVSDGSGNVYVTGYFWGTADFNPDGGDPRISNGDYDIFLSKFDSSGNFEWVRTWGGSGWDQCSGVATDGSGNVYITGKFNSTVDFDPGGGDIHTSKGGTDVFLSKFDSSGNFKWARTWGGSDHDSGNGVAADGSGNVYVTGYFRGTVDFDPGGGDLHTSNGPYDVFLSKFDPFGNFEWTRTWGGSAWDIGCGVASDGSGNVYITGNFGSTVDFDPGGGDPHICNGGYDVFLSKFDSSGNFEWARTWGGSDTDLGCGVAADGSGNVYITGSFLSTVDFYPGGGDPHTSNGGADVFLSKFDSLGNFEWARTWGGSAYDEGRGVATNGSGNVYATGYFQGTVDFNPEGGNDQFSNGAWDVFLSKFDSSGNFEWARTWGGSGLDDGRGVAADGSGNVYITGYFYNYTVDFAPTDPPCNEDPDEHTSYGYRDVFLTKHLPDGCW
jgi:hypothetical protein